jgi:hypothetical protein
MPTTRQIICYQLPTKLRKKLKACLRARLADIVYAGAVGINYANLKVPDLLLQRVLWNGLGKAEPDHELMQWVMSVAVPNGLGQLSKNASRKLFPTTQWTDRYKHVRMLKHNDHLYIGCEHDDELDLQLKRVEVDYLTRDLLPCIANVRKI